MKLVIIISMILGITVLGNTHLMAQESGKSKAELTTATIPVAGNCGHCKARIEAAAKSAKAKKASWDSETQALTVSFDPKVTNVEKIERKVADAGHDTELVKASDKKYKTLPGCCQYDRMEEAKK